MPKNYFESEHFQGLTYSGNELPPGEYDNCTFSNCIFMQADLSEIIFSDCIFTDCDLSMAILKGTAFREVQFKNCKLMGLRFDDCNTFSLSFDFEGCMLQFASFFKLKIPGTIFKDCKMEEVEFLEADLSKAYFKNCDLRGAIFGFTGLEGADLQSAVNFSIDPEANRLQKAKFSAQNISGLLDKYKIVIT